MKKTRRDRKNYNQGYQEGYLTGYAQGLYDGNPFNKIIKALSNLAENIKDNPELIEALKKMQEDKEKQDEKIRTAL